MQPSEEAAPKLDRVVQREMLQKLERTYPRQVGTDALGYTQTDPVLTRNILYLQEHGLVEAVSPKTMNGPAAVVLARITAKGLDFIADDGGLSAILGVVTVRLEAETLRALIEAKVDASSLPPEEKSRIREWLRKAGQEGLKQATTKLVSTALEHAPGLAMEAMKKLPDLFS